MDGRIAYRTWATATLFLTWGALASTVQAASITVPNFSFESPDAHTPFGVSTKIDNWTTYGETSFDTGGGPSSTGTGIFPNVNPDNSINFDNADQNQVAYAFSKSSIPANRDGLEQILTATFAANQVYTLRLAVGLAGANPGANDPFTFNLFYYDPANPTARPTVATNTIFNDGISPLSKTHLNDFAATSALLLPGNPAVGKQIGIEIFTALGSDVNATAGKQYDFDNVRVDATPEPATFATLAVVAVASLARRQRRATPTR
jgi:hypothetical protein